MAYMYMPTSDCSIAEYMRLQFVLFVGFGLGDLPLISTFSLLKACPALARRRRYEYFGPYIGAKLGGESPVNQMVAPVCFSSAVRFARVTVPAW